MEIGSSENTCVMVTVCLELLPTQQKSTSTFLSNPDLFSGTVMLTGEFPEPDEGDTMMSSAAEVCHSPSAETVKLTVPPFVDTVAVCGVTDTLGSF